MKKLLLSFAVAAVSFAASSQVIFSVLSPSNISGLYQFAHNGTGSSWGLANLDNPADAITGELMMVEDGTAGTNPQGNPVSQEGCGTLTNDLTGKIAVIYRNTCAFGLKALNAQNAGAIGVVIINRDPEIIDMAGGTEGASTTIPVVSLSSVDGEVLTTEMGNGPVTVFIGNKLDLYTNDLGSMPGDRMVAKAYALPSMITKTASDSMHFAIQVRNYGTADQINVKVIANVDFGGSSIYSDTSDLFNILHGDSLWWDFNVFAPTSYSNGKYTLTYSIVPSVTDEDPSDNISVNDFIVMDTLLSLAKLDPTTMLPIPTGGVMPSAATADYRVCIALQHPNSGRINAEGIYFSALTNSEDSLSEKEFEVSVLQINDDFANLDEMPDPVNFTPLTSGFYTYPVGPQDTMQNVIVYAAFEPMIRLEDNLRYMFCVKSPDDVAFIGHSTDINYETNLAYYNQPLVPISTADDFGLVGFGGDNVPAIAVKISENSQDIKEVAQLVEGTVYPNPSTDMVTISLKNVSGAAQLTVTDISGKTVMNHTIDLPNGQSKVNINTLEAGMYIFNIALENGATSQFNVVKK